MTRENLITALAEAVRKRGYDFYTGFEYRINNETSALPAAWLLPPEITKTEGRRQGVKHYSVTLKLMHDCPEHSPADKEALWAKMETDAGEISRELDSSEHVRNVAGMKCTPGELSLTNRGEISLSVALSVQMNFCYNNI